MRIIFIIGTSTGGVGTHVRALARDIAAAGHEVGVIGPASTEAHFGFSALPGVRFAALDVGTGIGPGDIALVTRLRSLLRGFAADLAPDIVHAHGFRAGLLTLLATRLLRSRPLFALSLHNQASGRGLRARVETGIERLLARGADLILGASTDLVERARELGARDARFLPAAAPAVRTIPAEAAAATREHLAEEFGFGPDALIVLSVGRVAPQKNYPMLVRALGRLGDTAPELVFLVAGAADEAVLDAVQSQYENLTDGQTDSAATSAGGAASAVPALHFLGPRDDVAELNAAADIFVLTSVWEARALVLQEALISGRAIIATATGGTSELVSDAGVLIGDDDDASLAEALTQLAADPARRAELGARAQARGAALPDERDVAKELLSIYTELLPS